MRLLVVGGTGWLGGQVVAHALAAGHQVATLTRGVSGEPPSGARALVADRDSADEVGRALAGHRFDAVVDTSGYTVDGARATARHLADVEAYAFVSSISAYRGWPPGPVRGTDDPTFTEVSDEYGPTKAESERVLSAALDGRLLVARAGLVVGPGDPTGRLGWWLGRMRAGGPVVVPVDAWHQPVAFVDVRDLAGWLVESVAQGRAGVVNAVGDAGMTTYGHLLEVCRDVVGADARRPVTWVERDDAALLAAGVERWTHLPFWLPADEARTVWQVDASSARAAGLPSRPIEETVRDLWAWLRDQPSPPGGFPPGDDGGGRRRPTFGLPPAVEALLVNPRPLG